ncbi:hypothetical protein [Peredibacter starrii]|uniref:Uncharacterized protein n=1 Tax=Peredibacter starrii TaxID=28202 RepID=A0AAX4HPT9_9BACT|nr:hypothetical protein [Peredibacter starrii]WPU65222.1 hypothetical protein SOO65_00480 [Peredibacter starrii]
MKWLLFTLLYICATSWAFAEAANVRWSRLGFVFEAKDELYRNQQQDLLLASTDIAEQLSDIQLSKLPSEARDKIKHKTITLIFEKNASTDAVFYPPGTKAGRGNDEWIITLNPALISTPDYLKIISHEYFHAVHYSINPNEVSWVREGLAQLFEYRLYNGFNFAHTHAGLTKNEFPLEAEFDINDYRPEKYGNTLLYFYYLTSHCDKDDTLFWTLVNSGGSGRDGINRALQLENSSIPLCRDFSSSAEGFSLAKMANSYSGFEQSSLTFIMPSSHRLQIDAQKELSLLANPDKFWSSIQSYQPQRLSLKTAQELIKTAPASFKWWGLEKNYPNRIKALKPQDLMTLSPAWDVGVLATDSL